VGEHSPDHVVVRDSLVDPAAFAAVFDRHYPAIYRYLARRLGRDAAVDVAAETFAVAFDDRRRFDARYESAGPWLFGIATNLARRFARSERRQLDAYSRTVTPDLDPEDGAEAVARADAHRLAPEVASAVGKLPQQSREVLLLYAWAELDYEGIAAALQIPVGTVRSRLSRARAEMRRLLTLSEARPHIANDLAQEIR
jgi:RNA polymerase sigma factor (sigma-70 family)